MVLKIWDLELGFGIHFHKIRDPRFATPAPGISTSKSESDDDIGPALPPGMCKKSHSIGPAMPPSVNKSEDEDDIGPALPPSMSARNVGPTMPPNVGPAHVKRVGPTIPTQDRVFESSNESSKIESSKFFLKKTLSFSIY